jgi:aminoglycoside phosphotransferase (APT) family kinase protein
MMDLGAHETRRLLQALRRMRLVQADEQPALTELAGGVSSLIVRADTARGPVCVKQALPQLKVAALWEAPVERNCAEVAWMRVAGQIVPGSVPIILGEDAQDNAFAMEWLAPDQYPVWKAQLRDGLADAAIAQAVGRNLVAIHAATAGDPAMARSFAHDEGFYAIRLEPYFVETARKHPQCAAALQQLAETTASNKRALVHGDVSPKNILIRPAPEAQHAASPVFLDAECAWYGDPAFDLAFCLNHLLLKCVWRPETTRGFLACFDALSRAYLQGANWEPPEQIEARAAALLAGMLLARIDGKSPVEYVTSDADRDRVRRFAIPLLLQPANTLSDIRLRWSTA